MSELMQFEIDTDTGFLPSRDPLRRLPEPFRDWDETAAELPRLLLAGRLRERIESLPEFREDRLKDERERRRAMMILSFLGHAYVWGAPEPSERIPAVLARPWVEVARSLGRPPVLSYASYALDNWRRLDPDGEIETSNIALLQNFLGGADEDWFVLIHIEIEARAARALRSMLPAQRLAAMGDVGGVESNLEEVAIALQEINGCFQRMPDFCDPAIYFRRVRPFIFGWKDHPALPKGLRYEGVESDDWKKLRGETGAQSGIVPSLDALLGIDHSDDPLRHYLAEMRDYMPPAHRAFVERLEAGPSVAEFVRARVAEFPSLGEVYDECVQWVVRFRALHVEYAQRYIHQQSGANRANPNAVGTGGTPFMAYLRKHRDESEAALLS